MRRFRRHKRTDLGKEHDKADQVLSRLEEGSKNDNDSQDGKIKGKGDMKDIGKARDGYQLSFFQLDDPLLSQIRDRLLGINIDNLTPLQALTGNRMNTLFRRQA